MSRKKRLDYPDALHHIYCRGVEKRRIFIKEHDYIKFLESLGKSLLDTGTKCFAWALIPNHFHLLLQTGYLSISQTMHSLLTSYALYFNKKYDRVGPLFQGRFGSTLCDQDKYFFTLISYVSTNPIKHGIIKDIRNLERFKWSSHKSVMHINQYEWFNKNLLLESFHKEKDKAITRYNNFILNKSEAILSKNLRKNRFIKNSNGIWIPEEKNKKDEETHHDERILGDTQFVKDVLLKANSGFGFHEKSKRPSIKQIIRNISRHQKISSKQLLSRGRTKKISQSRALICCVCINLNYQLNEISSELNISREAVRKAGIRGDQLKIANGLDINQFVH